MLLVLNHTNLSQALNLAVQQLKLESYHAYLKEILHTAMTNAINDKRESTTLIAKTLKHVRQIGCKQVLRNEFQADYLEVMKCRSLIYATQIPSHLTDLGVSPQNIGMLEAYSFDPKQGKTNALNKPKKTTDNSGKVSKPRQAKSGRKRGRHISPKAQLGRKSRKNS